MKLITQNIVRVASHPNIVKKVVGKPYTCAISLTVEPLLTLAGLLGALVALVSLS